MILNIILGSLLFLSIIFLLVIKRNIKKKYISRAIILKKMKSIVKKRGIFTGAFTWSEDGNNTTLTYRVEFTVIDETQDMVKLKSGHIMCSNQTYLKDYHKNAYTTSVENNWFDKADTRLNFFKESKESIRDRKIEQLLDEA